MTQPENIQHIDIDNEIDQNEIQKKSIDDKLNSKERDEALSILKIIDVQISGYDIDLTFNPQEKKYYYVSSDLEKNENNDKLKLSIPINLEEIESTGKILINLFDKKLELKGNLHYRDILEKEWHIFANQLATSDSTAFEKGDIEELFVFVMNTKKIPMKDWKLDGPICQSGYNDECKKELGNK